MLSRVKFFFLWCSCSFMTGQAVAQSIHGADGVGNVSAEKWDNLRQDTGYYRVPYSFGDNLGNATKDKIQLAISAIYAQTCIKFEPAKVVDTSIIKFVNGSGCTSFTGRNSGVNKIYGCKTVGKILEAIMYALGFRSETLRSDRDDYVILFPEDMIKRKLPLIQKLAPGNEETFGLPYDLNSITHFGPNEYSATGETTVYNNVTGLPMVKNKWALSLNDVAKINAMYNCNVTGVNVTTDCYHTVDNGLMYRGNVSLTENGEKCQNWRGQKPHKHNFIPSRVDGSGLQKNYCRNPTMRERPWCYTKNSTVKWDYCNIAQCNTTEKLSRPTPLTSRRGFWGPWSPYSRCSRNCGDGYMYSTRRCIGADVGSEACPGNYWRHLACNYGNCSSTSAWGHWEGWSECDAPCENGTKVRVRYCEGITGLGECVGDSVETMDCITGISCPLYEGGECVNRSNVAGYRGTMNVDRHGSSCINWVDSKLIVSNYPNAGLEQNYCRNPDGKRKVPYCFVARNKRSACNITRCNPNAVWSRWDSWSSCSVSCGEGIITRTRVCMFGHYGEGSCKGNTSMTSACNITCMGGVPILPDELEPPVTSAPQPTTPPSGRECLDFRNPRGYRGSQNRSKSGLKCQEWDAIYPWSHNYSDDKLILDAGLSENYCRTPDPGDKTPWCFVKEFTLEKEDCFIPSCPFNTTQSDYFTHLWASFLENLGVSSNNIP